jgi:hypothetical protein
LSTATPFPFDPQPGAAARGTVPGGGSSARPERHGAPDGESDFARSLLEVQENDNTAGAETPVPPDSRAAGAQAVAATENGGAPHEVSAFLARLFASGHPDQPALGKTFAPGQADTGEGEPPTDAAAGLAETLEDALAQPDAAENGETPEAEVTAEAITDPAILAAALTEDESAGEAVPPQATEGEEAAGPVKPQAATATETKAAPPVADATPLPDGEDAEATDTAGAGETDLPEMEAAAAASTASALNSAPQSEAARARNAAHLPPLPENANPRAQAMARRCPICSGS